MGGQLSTRLTRLQRSRGELALTTLSQKASPVSFADFMLAVPPMVRLLLALAITISVTVLCVRAFHSQIRAINEDPPLVDGQPENGIQPTRDLGGRLIGLATFAFVFLLAFGFGQFWNTAKDARAASQSEAIDYAQAVALAQRLPAEEGTPLLTALETYRQGIVDVEWPLMQRAKSEELAQARQESTTALGTALLDARQGSDSGDPVWSNLSTAVDDLLTDGNDRADSLPGPAADSVILLVLFFGLATLVLTALFQPARLKASIIIMAAMAALTAFLLFAIVEISNPYNGAGAITSRLAQF